MVYGSPQFHNFSLANFEINALNVIQMTLNIKESMLPHT